MTIIVAQQGSDQDITWRDNNPMSKTLKLEAVFVELDCLLDTRLGTIAKISTALADKVLNHSNGSYHTRQADIFEGVDMDLYRTLYASRDVETLTKSMCSGTLRLVKDLVGQLTSQAVARPYHDGVKIVVNTYPYNLSPEELDEIGKAIMAWTHSLAPIELVNLQPESLTPEHCKQEYAMMIIYDYETWMDTHAQAFAKTRIPEIVMFGPAIYKDRVPSNDELEQLVKESAHPFKAIELLASPIVELTLIDVKYFSIIAK